LQALNKRRIYTKALFVSGNEELPDVEHALRLGARGYVPKSLPSAEMVAAIKKVLNGDLFWMSRSTGLRATPNLMLEANPK